MTAAGSFKPSRNSLMLDALTLVVHLLPLALLGLVAWRPMSRLGLGSARLLAMSYHSCTHYLGAALN
jgi:hypothetical protein